MNNNDQQAGTRSLPHPEVIEIFDLDEAQKRWESGPGTYHHFMDIMDDYEYDRFETANKRLVETTFKGLAKNNVHYKSGATYDEVARIFPDVRVRTCLVDTEKGWTSTHLYVELDSDNERDQLDSVMSDSGIYLRGGADNKTGWYYFEDE